MAIFLTKDLNSSSDYVISLKIERHVRIAGSLPELSRRRYCGIPSAIPGDLAETKEPKVAAANNIKVPLPLVALNMVPIDKVILKTNRPIMTKSSRQVFFLKNLLVHWDELVN